ncbi:MAG: hypothetical protein AMXMBFR6_02880 [Betaproteobacteria bacterium]
MESSDTCFEKARSTTRGILTGKGRNPDREVGKRVAEQGIIKGCALRSRRSACVRFRAILCAIRAGSEFEPPRSFPAVIDGGSPGSGQAPA